MRLKSIKVKGLGPFGEFGVDLADYGDDKLIAVTGANGAGKSTLLELWTGGALFRDCATRGSLNSLATERQAYVEVEIEHLGEWTIRHMVDAVSGKGESFVFDADGEPVIKTGKLRDFDAWAREHLPSPEVLYSSVVAPQGYANFLGAKPSERKGILLRVLGIERLERLAERARKALAAERGKAVTLDARIGDERERVGDLDALQAAAEATRREAARWEAKLAELTTRLETVKKETILAEASALEFRRVDDLRRNLVSKTQDSKLQICDIERRIRNNQGVLDDGNAIRKAVLDLEKTKAELATAERDLQNVDAEIKGIFAPWGDYRSRVGALNGRISDSQRRIEVAEKGEKATLKLDDLAETHGAAKKGLAAAKTVLEDLVDQQITDSGGRILALRDGLQKISKGETNRPIDLATDTLEADDSSARSASEFPGKLEAAKEAFRDACKAEDRSGFLLQNAQRDAVKAEGLNQHRADLQKDQEELQELEKGSNKANLKADKIREGASNITSAIKRLKREIEELAPVAAKSDRLAQAQARIDELAPQLAKAKVDITALEAELKANPLPPEPAPGPNTAHIQVEVKNAEGQLVDSRSAHAVANERYDSAKKADVRLRELKVDRKALDAEIADWTRLAADLGRDGIQALEIDAAGPELATLTNELLHDCIGPRWSVSIETQKLSADGKKVLEGCEVRVIDSERGREAEASTFSGGERVIIGEAVSLALCTLACRRSGVERPTLVRDESGAALSPENSRAYVKMLRLAARIVGADRVLIVSHNSDVVGLCDGIVEIA